MHRSFPTPKISVLEIGLVTIHIYALCIIVGIAIAIWLGNKRFLVRAVNGHSVVSEVAFLAVPCGVIGGRIYHVISSPAPYFGANGNPLDALKIWQGGLGIWGAISIGTLAAWFRYKQLAKRIDLPTFALFMDALAPGVLFAQAVGRFGNWFNGELFGRPLIAPWSLEIPLSKRPIGFEKYATFHPTFLYEALWCAIAAIFLIVLKERLYAGQIFTLYILIYCIGRFFFEIIRIDSANTIGGVRVNVWVSALVGVSALVIYWLNLHKSRKNSGSI